MILMMASLVWACMEPTPFETDPAATVVNEAAFGSAEVTVGRWGTADAPSEACEGYTYVEVVLDVPDDVGVMLDVETQSSGISPPWGDATGPWRTDEPIYIAWPETDLEAAETMHFGLSLWLVDASGELGEEWLWEVYDTERGPELTGTTGGGGTNGTTGGYGGGAGTSTTSVTTPGTTPADPATTPPTGASTPTGSEAGDDTGEVAEESKGCSTAPGVPLGGLLLLPLLGMGRRRR